MHFHQKKKNSWIERVKVSKRKILFITGAVSGMIATLMLFVIPFVLFAFNINDDKYALPYFITFLVLTAIGNITLEKANSTTLEDIRDEKIDQIIN